VDVLIVTEPDMARRTKLTTSTPRPEVVRASEASKLTSAETVVSALMASLETRSSSSHLPA